MKIHSIVSAAESVRVHRHRDNKLQQIALLYLFLAAIKKSRAVKRKLKIRDVYNNSVYLVLQWSSNEELYKRDFIDRALIYKICIGSIHSCSVTEYDRSGHLLAALIHNQPTFTSKLATKELRI